MTAPGPQGPVDATEPRNVGTGDRATGYGMPEDRQNVEEDEMPIQREEVADTEMSEGNGSSERGRDSFDDAKSRQIKRRRRGRYRMRGLP